MNLVIDIDTFKLFFHDCLKNKIVENSSPSAFFMTFLVKIDNT